MFVGTRPLRGYFLTRVPPTSSPRVYRQERPAFRQLPSLTGLRWVAAFLVFAYHVRNFGYFAGSGGKVVKWAFGPGFTGVSFFFVLSGFVLAWSARDGDRPMIFWRRRLARVYPVHLVTALLALLLAATLVPGLRPSGLPETVANLLLVSAWRAEWWQALNPVSWSLTCEAFFYACFPALFAVLRRLGSRQLAGLVITAGMAVIGLAWLDSGHQLGVPLNTFPPVRLPELVLGASSARLVQTSSWRGPGLRTAAAVAIAGYFLTAHVPAAYRVAACTVLGFGLLVPAAAAADLTGAPSILRHPLLVRLGEWSFAFYMIHILVLRLGEQLFVSAPHLPMAEAMAAAAVVFGVSLALAWLLFECVEVPGRKLILSRRDRRPRPAPAPRHSGMSADNGEQVPGWHRQGPAVRRRTLRVVIAGLLCAAPLVVGQPVTAGRSVSGPPWSSAVGADRAIPPGTGAIVVIGASVSAGYRAAPGGDWPRLLAGQLTKEGARLHVVNASISATRLLVSADGLPSALDREDHDALSIPQTRVVVLTDLINDIQQTPHQYDAQVITDGLRRFVQGAHAKGVRVIGTTIPPYGGFLRYEPAGEDTRQAVNNSIRTDGTFDAVLDFDNVLADPQDSIRMRPDLDSGDHLHPNEAGHQALAESIDLRSLAEMATR